MAKIPRRNSLKTLRPSVELTEGGRLVYVVKISHQEHVRVMILENPPKPKLSKFVDQEVIDLSSKCLNLELDFEDSKFDEEFILVFEAMVDSIFLFLLLSRYFVLV